MALSPLKRGGAGALRDPARPCVAQMGLTPVQTCPRSGMGSDQKQSLRQFVAIFSRGALPANVTPYNAAAGFTLDVAPEATVPETRAEDVERRFSLRRSCRARSVRIRVRRFRW